MFLDFGLAKSFTEGAPADVLSLSLTIMDIGPGGHRPRLRLSTAHPMEAVIW